MIAAALATAVCVIAVALLVDVERRGDRRGRWRYKPLASAAFVAVPLVAGAVTGDRVPVWITLGLVWGAVGDVALIVESDRAFLTGLVAFLLGHIAYVLALAGIAPPSTWVEGAMLGAIAGAAIAGAAVLTYLWPRLGSMRIPVIGYVAVISAMLVGGIAVSAVGPGGTSRALLTAGACAFYASDLAVAREKFVVHDPRNRIVGLPVYYGAQLLFGWALVVA